MLILAQGAIQVGLDLIFFKFAQALIKHGTFADDWLLTSVLLISAAVLALLNLHFVNLGVKFYDQTDVVPIYIASLLLSILLSGLIIDGEFHLYNSAQLVGILISSLVCIAGIQVLVMKKSSLSLGQDGASRST